jgi:cytochrome bd-type quinol oxidase subunit 2
MGQIVMDATPSPESLRRRYSRVKRLALFLASVGFVAQMVARTWFRAAAAGERDEPLWMALAATLLVLLTSVVYVRVKGRSAWWGLLGLLSIFGFVTLLCLERCCHRCRRKVPVSAESCPDCNAPV